MNRRRRDVRWRKDRCAAAIDALKQMTHAATTRYAVHVDRDEIIRVLRTFLKERFDLKMRTEMRVQKFRSIEEMNKAPVPESNEPPFERFLRHCERYRAIAPKEYPRGVFKFRSIEEAQKAREKHVLLKK